MYYQQNNERQKHCRKEVNENSAFSASRDIQLKFAEAMTQIQAETP